ncbi:ABC transporter ATP-binding protein [Actinoplanes siamensis]|uniref:ABC transporter ATP-binding protein n=1 Tax=Actinoplanes siamensis TaxID=1223317 RepID=A0A919TPN3_9ACTN|nr:ABC transporter ATP-binding protein [Actinoplanes siamensis]GIF09040.1 ABC transporter ATP-binding protein [Actinoplanes siamensis]
MSGLRVDGLSMAYGDAPALHEVSFTVAPGEMFGLVGESGCGKSTLGYLLGGHLHPGARVLGGRIEVDGVDVLSLRGAALSRWRSTGIAFVHQEASSSLDPTMRVGRQVEEVLRAHGLGRREAAARALELLRQVRLPDAAALARRYPHQLSGGQQQRVVIACALAGRPRLLVLDEPTTGLDASVQREVLALLVELVADLSAAVVLISHDVELVGQVCDRVGVLYAGRLVEVGAASDVLREPAHPYTAGLLDGVPRIGVPRTVRRLRPIGGSPPAPGEPIAGCAFAARCPVADDRCTAAEPVLDEAAVAGRAVRCIRPGSSPRTGASPVGDEPAPAEAAEPKPLLEIRGLVRRYGRTVAVDHVDLTIGAGEILGLVGESGSGKTTLARAITGLAPDGDGELLLDGVPLPARLSRRPVAVRRRVQMVFQNFDAALNPAHRIRHILERAIRTLHGDRDLRLLTDRTQIDPSLLDRRPERLSGGQKQRVAIARSLAGDPSVIVCDEPVSALDLSVQAGVLELLAAERDRNGTSLLFVSHDLAVVDYLADRVAVMYRGQIVEQGTTADVLEGPHHPYTQTLLAAPGGATRTVPVAGGCRFVAACPQRVPGLCENTPPPVVSLGAGHTVRCHLEPSLLPRRTRRYA